MRFVPQCNEQASFYCYETVDICAWRRTLRWCRGTTSGRQCSQAARSSSSPTTDSRQQKLTNAASEHAFHTPEGATHLKIHKKAQTNPRDAKACQKLLQFDVLTTLSLTILAYLQAFSCCCVRNLRHPEKFTENSNFWSSRSSKVIDFGANRKPICDVLLVINSNFSRICYRFRDIHG